MRVLFLGRGDSAILDYMRRLGTELRVLGPDDLVDDDRLVRWADRVVSHGYRRIISSSILSAAPGRFLNCHISLLPWNRGSDTNLWSVLEDTPRGVSIHVVDPGVDTGDIVAQRAVALDEGDTLATSYEALQSALADLFRATWPTLAVDRLVGHRQPEGGNVHRTRDRSTVANLLTEGWDTPVSRLLGRLPAHTGAAHR
jgi:methionyl-tRNA formyltransferase